MSCEVQEIISKGVSIGVISQNRIFDVKSVTDNPMELILVLVEFARANNESQTKSTRSKSVIQSKIERVKTGEKIWFGVQKPSWVVSLKDGKFMLDETKVALVRDIFTRYLRGQSCNNIANELNVAKVSTLRNMLNGIWTNSTVAELLRNKNAIGWFGINDQEFDNYFPAIISPVAGGSAPNLGVASPQRPPPASPDSKPPLVMTPALLARVRAMIASKI